MRAGLPGVYQADTMARLPARLREPAERKTNHVHATMIPHAASVVQHRSCTLCSREPLTIVPHTRQTAGCARENRWSSLHQPCNAAKTFRGYRLVVGSVVAFGVSTILRIMPRAFRSACSWLSSCSLTTRRVCNSKSRAARRSVCAVLMSWVRLTLGISQYRE